MMKVLIVGAGPAGLTTGRGMAEMLLCRCEFLSEWQIGRGPSRFGNYRPVARNKMRFKINSQLVGTPMLAAAS